MIQPLLTANSTNIQNIIEGKIFISDEDASHFDPAVARTVINLKMKIIAILDSIMALYLEITANDSKFDIQLYSDAIQNYYGNQ